MLTTKRLSSLSLLGLLCAFSASQADPILLPEPTDTHDGIPVATQFNDFYSYSGGLLRQWNYLTQQQYTGQGTGTLDLILGTGAGGANNVNTGPGGAFTFESPMPFPSGAGNPTFDGSWGDGTQANGPVMVDNLVNYLNAVNPGDTVPVFIFDHNQTGANPDLSVQAEAYIWDPVNEMKVDSWHFDDGMGNPALSPGEISVTGDSGTTYTVNNNLGSGQLDFLVFAPTMDLADYVGEGYWFVGDFAMFDLNNGFEELYMTGRFATGQQIPEPALLALFGFGLLALGLVARRRRGMGPGRP